MIDTPSEPRLITTGLIAARLGVPLHRVQHILATRKHIVPSARAGALRLYDRRAVAMVRDELDAIDARRSKGGAS
jgi:hypothetical protein